MKNILLLLSLCLLTYLSRAQETKIDSIDSVTDTTSKPKTPIDLSLNKISVFSGLTLSSFLYDETTLAYNNQYAYTADASLGLNFEFTSRRHVLKPEILYKRLGSSTTINDTEIQWKLSYLELNIGYLFRVLDNPKFKISTGLNYGLAYMMDGYQTIGQIRFDVGSAGFLNRLDLTGNFLLNFAFQIRENLHLFAEYRFGMSILNIEKDNNQTTRNMYHTVGLGLSYVLPPAPNKQ